MHIFAQAVKNDKAKKNNRIYKTADIYCHEEMDCFLVGIVLAEIARDNLR